MWRGMCTIFPSGVETRTGAGRVPIRPVRPIPGRVFEDGFRPLPTRIDRNEPE